MRLSTSAASAASTASALVVAVVAALVAAMLLAAPAARAAIVERFVAPLETDPAISQGLADHYVALDPAVPPVGDLFVFLAGTGGIPKYYQLIVQEGAEEGFHAIGLSYPSSAAVAGLCGAGSAPDCTANVRLEMITGVDASPDVDIPPPDSIESRLLHLLATLAARFPAEGWGRYLVDGAIDWRHVRVAGHSQGAGHAAFLGKLHDLAGVGCLAGPGDWDVDRGRPAPWLSAPGLTPVSRIYGFQHLQDEAIPWAYGLLCWRALGLEAFGAPASVDGATPPYGGSHELTTNLPLAYGTYHGMVALDAFAPRNRDSSLTYAPVWRTVCFQHGAATASSWLLPSSARVAGGGGAVWTTDLSIANPTAAAAEATVTFLGHDRDGRTGPTATVSIPPGATMTWHDVLAALFGVSEGWGAILVRSSFAALAVSSQTATPGAGGTFGQGVPAFSDGDLVRAGASRSLLDIREGGGFRTNLVLANATEAPLDVDVTLVSAAGVPLASARVPLLPLGMTQLTRAARVLGVAGDVAGARLVVGTQTAGGAFAAYASAIDATTNDPRTLLPR